MAHAARVKKVPHRNKNGTMSATRCDYIAFCRSRGKTCLEIRYLKRADAEACIESHRESAYIKHRVMHPNDMHHYRKHNRGKAPMVPSTDQPAVQDQDYPEVKEM